jgi:hypothetical protein
LPGFTGALCNEGRVLSILKREIVKRKCYSAVSDFPKDIALTAFWCAVSAASENDCEL